MYTNEKLTVGSRMRPAPAALVVRLFPGEQHASKRPGILDLSASKEAVVATGVEDRGEMVMATQSQEMRELSDGELALVCGGTIDVVGRAAQPAPFQTGFDQSKLALAKQLQDAYWTSHDALVGRPI